MQLAAIRAEIEHTRRQVQRQRKGIQSLQRASISTGSADALSSARMLTKADELAAERDRLVEKTRLKFAGTEKFIQRQQIRIGGKWGQRRGRV